VATEKLTRAKIYAARAPSLISDGGGLYLQTEPSGSQSWVFRFSLASKDRKIGLGGLDTVDLRQARERARQYRGLVAKGVDPLVVKRQECAYVEHASQMTFRKVALTYIARREQGWSTSNAKQWRDQFERHVFPKIGTLTMPTVNNTAVVLEVLEPLWTERPSTAGRLRARLETIIDWAKFKGYCKGDNVARWKGHLKEHLLRPSEIRPVRHYRAIPYREIPQFLLALRKRRGLTALALQFTLFAAGRQKETREARWSEFDLAGGLWTIPAIRLKTRKTRSEPHQVVLTPPMLTILAKVMPRKLDDNSLVFPGRAAGKPIGDAVMRHLMNEMGYRGLASPHGLRRSFKTWASEQTRFNRLEVELALAHAIPGTEGIYLDSELLENRALLGQAWADFCLGRVPARAANAIRLRHVCQRGRALVDGS
jgi:integrase